MTPSSGLGAHFLLAQNIAKRNECLLIIIVDLQSFEHLRMQGHKLVSSEDCGNATEEHFITLSL